MYTRRTESQKLSIGLFIAASLVAIAGFLLVTYQPVARMNLTIQCEKGEASVYYGARDTEECQSIEDENLSL